MDKTKIYFTGVGKIGSTIKEFLEKNSNSYGLAISNKILTRESDLEIF